MLVYVILLKIMCLIIFIISDFPLLEPETFDCVFAWYSADTFFFPPPFYYLCRLGERGKHIFQRTVGQPSEIRLGYYYSILQ